MAKTFTQAELDAAVAAAVAAQGGNKPVKFEAVKGVNKTSKKPYTGVRVTGNFPPFYMSRTVANAVSANADALAKALTQEPREIS